jgi:hypothetical protein
MSIGHFVVASVQFGDAAKLDDRRTPLSSRESAKLKHEL